VVISVGKISTRSGIRCVSKVSDEDVGDYELLKNNLLMRFRLTEGGYRKRFKQSKIENGETPEQFIDRLRRYLQKWRQSVVSYG